MTDAAITLVAALTGPAEVRLRPASMRGAPGHYLLIARVALPNSTLQLRAAAVVGEASPATWQIASMRAKCLTRGTLVRLTGATLQQPGRRGDRNTLELTGVSVIEPLHKPAPLPNHFEREPLELDAA